MPQAQREPVQARQEPERLALACSVLVLVPQGRAQRVQVLRACWVALERLAQVLQRVLDCSAMQARQQATALRWVRSKPRCSLHNKLAWGQCPFPAV